MDGEKLFYRSVILALVAVVVVFAIKSLPEVKRYAEMKTK